ncbi:MAG: hypothetical protein JNM63_17780 [Spirochaetia bacterium]|nr:hypothetical protein [Spirochaetia bacterium]
MSIRIGEQLHGFVQTQEIRKMFGNAKGFQIADKGFVDETLTLRENQKISNGSNLPCKRPIFLSEFFLGGGECQKVFAPERSYVTLFLFFKEFDEQMEVGPIGRHGRWSESFFHPDVLCELSQERIEIGCADLTHCPKP